MTRPGADLALLLLGGFLALADAASAELAERGHPKIRPVHDFAIRGIDRGAETVAELGRQLGVSKQAAAKTVAFLEERGYVCGQADPHDSRRRRYTVTEEGRSLLRIGEEVFDDLRDQWAQRIGWEELARLEDALGELGIRIPSDLNARGFLSSTGQ